MHYLYYSSEIYVHLTLIYSIKNLIQIDLDNAYCVIKFFFILNRKMLT